MTTHAQAYDEALLNQLTGATSSEPFPDTVTQDGIDGKFKPDGTAVRFPGNTFICHIDPASDAYAALVRLQNEVRNGPYSEYFTQLPPESLHMTVFPSVCGDPLGYDGFPDGFAKGTGLGEITETYRTRALETTGFASCTISALKPFLGYSVHVDGATPSDRNILSQMRQTLQSLTGLRRPDFSAYQFHITLAYRIKWMSEDIAKAHLDHMDTAFNDEKDALVNISLGQIEFCSFEDMTHFERLALLPAH